MWILDFEVLLSLRKFYGLLSPKGFFLTSSISEVSLEYNCSHRSHTLEVCSVSVISIGFRELTNEREKSASMSDILLPYWPVIVSNGSPRPKKSLPPLED